jgi:DNA-binding beta-propeller fold protein YncE
MNFNRVATFPVCSQIDSTCNDDTETVAEIVSATDDGMTVIYTDSPRGVIGFIDIAEPSNPLPMGVVDVGGEPTSVVVWGDYAIAAVDTSEDFINPSGVLVAINIATRQIEKSWDLGGQPDSVAASPDGKYIVVAIENQRDEDLGEGIPPQVSYLFVFSCSLENTMWHSQ